MAELLSTLAGPNPYLSEETWARCQEAQKEIERELAAGLPATEEERADLRAGLERLVRLNAIARQTADQIKEGMQKDLVAAKQLGKQLQGYAGRASATGGTCDMAG